MNNIIMLKKTLYLSLSIMAGWIVFGNFEPEPSGFITRLEEGNLISDEIKNIADNYNSKTHPPYFFSTYSPKDELYEPVLAIQQDRAYDAVDKLEELAAQDNADALYWLAEITYKSSAFSGQTGAELFEHSAKLGNPYAALMLDDSNHECQKHMPSHCDKKWGELAKKILVERESNGDLEASYTLIPDLKTASREDYEKLERLTYQGFNQGYSMPLYFFVTLFRHSVYDSEEQNNLSFSEKDNRIFDRLILVMASSHHRMALFKVISNEQGIFTESEILEVIKNNLNTMGNSYPSILSYLGNKTGTERQDQIYWASFAKVADTYQDSMRKNSNFRRYHSRVKSHSNEFTKEELEIIDQLATENLKKATPNIFISMACPDGIGSCLRVNE